MYVPPVDSKTLDYDKIEKYTVEVPLIPKSVNHCYVTTYNKKQKRVCRFLGKEGKKFIDAVHKSLENHPCRMSFPLTNKKYKVRVTIFYGDKIRRDIDNNFKIVLDSLNREVIEDDYHIDELSIKRRYDFDNPRTVIEILVLQQFTPVDKKKKTTNSRKKKKNTKT